MSHTTQSVEEMIDEHRRWLEPIDQRLAENYKRAMEEYLRNSRPLVEQMILLEALYQPAFTLHADGTLDRFWMNDDAHKTHDQLKAAMIEMRDQCFTAYGFSEFGPARGLEATAPALV